MNFINPINKLGNIKDVADEYEIEFNDIDKESAMGLYGVAILIWDQRIHAKFIIWFNINPKKLKVYSLLGLFLMKNYQSYDILNYTEMNLKNSCDMN